MNILVLNASPKGKNSVTLQTALYLEKKYPAHAFKVLNVGQTIKHCEKNFSQLKPEFQTADVILFVYPVYTFLAPYQLHRFIELMKENSLNLNGKFASQITTSKHFYDITAHKYIEENCADFGMKYIQGLSADMDDLLREKGQKQALSFFDTLLFNIENDIYINTTPNYVKKEKTTYKQTLATTEKTGKKDVVIVTNCSENDENLQNMIADFKNHTKHKVREINVRNFQFSGGCLGCMNCAVTGKCIYRDGFDDFLRNEIQTADSIVYAMTIENHYTHSSFKCYDDRQFCNGHRAVTMGMSIGYIISGDYSNEQNVKTLVEARSEVGGVYLAGVATDENDTAKSIKNLVVSLERVLDTVVYKSENFYGIGGTKIFRDLIYLMQGMMKADHKFYKKHGIYDFPHNNKLKILQMYFIFWLISLPAVKKKIKGGLGNFIIEPYKKVIENANTENNTVL